MYCTACGTELQDGARFCTTCGTQANPPQQAREAGAFAQVPISSGAPSSEAVDQYGLPILNPNGSGRNLDAARDQLPRPPSLHWGLVLLFTALTFGIFGWVWYFIQSSWVKKIDKRSNATVYFICGLALMLLAVPLSMYNVFANNGQPGLGTSMLVLLLEIVMLVFMYCGFFSMAASIREEMPKRGLRPDIGGITLFFFTVLYLQGQLSWIARWKDTGQKNPLPPKGIFWGLLLVPIVLTGFLAAIAVSQYQDYVIRSQVSEGSSLADGTKTAVAEYYNNYSAFPSENALAGLPAPASIAGKYVSSVEVASDGTITTRFSDTPPQQANPKIDGKVLTFKGAVRGDSIEWACDSSAGTTIDNKYRPSACRD